MCISLKTFKYNGYLGVLPFPDWLKPAPKSQSIKKEPKASVKHSFNTVVSSENDEVLPPIESDVDGDQQHQAAAETAPPYFSSSTTDQDAAEGDEYMNTAQGDIDDATALETATPYFSSSTIDQDTAEGDEFTQDDVDDATTLEVAASYSPSAQKRRWHPKGIAATSSEEDVSNFSPKDQELIDRIFNHTQFDSVSWREMRNLWESINGKGTARQNSGGSHVTLYHKNKTVVGGIFAHNDAQTYGYRGIRFIRDALWDIGCRRSRF
jgi:hypothetical protein